MRAKDEVTPDWGSAPVWAKWHTWDRLGCTWWRVQPYPMTSCKIWGKQGASESDYQCYDPTPLPDYIDDYAATARRRP